MIVFDGYKNHLFTQFEQFYKEKNIVILHLPIYSLYFIQPLDVDCFNVLKCSYGKEIESFIKVYINYIIKFEFFIMFKAAHLTTITSKNIKVEFRGVGLILYDL